MGLNIDITAVSINPDYVYGMEGGDNVIIPVDALPGGRPGNNTQTIGGSGGAVSSVNGQTGAVVLGKADVGLGNVDDTSDASKPLSTAAVTALAGKISTGGLKTLNGVSLEGGGNIVVGGGGAVNSVNGQTGTVVLVKSDIGLGSVDNTADVDKPVSTATAAALAGKAATAHTHNPIDVNFTGPSLLGRGAAGAGGGSEVTVGAGLALSAGGVLSATAVAGGVSSHANQTAFPATGVAGTLYIAEDTGNVYRWNGAAYVQAADEVRPVASAASRPVTGTSGVLYLALDTGQLSFWNGVAYQNTAGSGGATNLSSVVSPTGIQVNSDTGTDVTLPLADGTNAGLLSPAGYLTINSMTAFGQSLVDDANATAARTTLGLGTAATSAVGDFATAAHTHPVATAAAAGFAPAAPVVDSGKVLRVAAAGGYELATLAGGSPANLAATPSPTGVAVSNSNGTGFTLALADATNAGAMSPGDFTKLGGLPTGAALTASLAGKQAALTFDTGPVSGSVNPVTSGGVFTSLSGKQDTLVSGSSIKTIHGNSMLGSGDVLLFTVGTAAPAAPSINQLWVDTN